MEWNEYNNRLAHDNEITSTRKGFLGGSDAAMVYKIGRKGIGSLSNTDRKRIAVLLGYDNQKPFGGNKWTEAGHDFEDNFEKVAKTWESGYQREKVLNGAKYRHFATIAHADYVDGKGVVYELKCVNKNTERVIVTYYAQLQWYYMLGAEAVYLVHTSDPNSQYAQRFIQRNDGVIGALREGLQALDDYCGKINETDCTVTEERVTTLPLDIESAIYLWRNGNKAIDNLRKQQQRYEQIILGYMQRNSVDRIINCDGTSIVIDTAHRQIDESVLLQRYPQTLKDGDIFTTTQTRIKEIQQ